VAWAQLFGVVGFELFAHLAGVVEDHALCGTARGPDSGCALGSKRTAYATGLPERRGSGPCARRRCDQPLIGDS
jgi:hypothetical protein